MKPRTSGARGLVTSTKDVPSEVPMMAISRPSAGSVHPQMSFPPVRDGETVVNNMVSKQRTCQGNGALVGIERCAQHHRDLSSEDGRVFQGNGPLVEIEVRTAS